MTQLEFTWESLDAFPAAVEESQKSLAEYLKQTNHIGENAFLYAIRTKQLETAKYIIEQIENDHELLKEVINAQDYEGSTPLHKAVYYLPEIIPIILALEDKHKGILDLSLKNTNENTIIHCFANYSNENISYDLFKILCKIIEGREYADDVLKNTNVRGKTVLHAAACRSNNTEIIKFLLERVIFEISDKRNHGGNVLHCAAENGNIEILKCLVKHLEETNNLKLLEGKDDNGNTILHWAAQYGHRSSNCESSLTMVKYIIEKLSAQCEDQGIDKKIFDPKARNDNGKNALHCAIKSNTENTIEIFQISKETVEYLIEQGCGVNQLAHNQGKTKFATPLSIAIKHGRNDFVSILLKRGATYELIAHYELGRLKEVNAEKSDACDKITVFLKGKGIEIERNTTYVWTQAAEESELAKAISRGDVDDVKRLINNNEEFAYNELQAFKILQETSEKRSEAYKAIQATFNDCKIDTEYSTKNVEKLQYVTEQILPEGVLWDNVNSFLKNPIDDQSMNTASSLYGSSGNKSSISGDSTPDTDMNVEDCKTLVDEHEPKKK